MAKQVIQHEDGQLITLNTADEMIAVIQAYKNGKTIECRSIDEVNGDWFKARDDIEPNELFNFRRAAYRVKENGETIDFDTELEIVKGSIESIGVICGLFNHSQSEIDEIFDDIKKSFAEGREFGLEIAN